MDAGKLTDFGAALEIHSYLGQPPDFQSKGSDWQ